MNQFAQYDNEVLDSLYEEPTISNWIDHDASGASNMLGEDIYSAVVEALGYE